MALKELDDLLALLSPTDRDQFDSILQRNQNMQDALAGRETVYNAFIAGQDPATVVRPTRPTPAALDIAALDAELARRVPTMFKSYLESPDAQTLIDARAEARAKALVESSTGSILGRAAHLSDEIYSIRRSHDREFGEELDSAALTKYMEDNPGKFKSITDAHNSFVQQKRIDKAIADGTEKGVAARMAAMHTNEVPGSSLPTSQTPLGAMMRDNAARTQTAGSAAADRGTGLDAAATHFRELQAKHAVN